MINFDLNIDGNNLGLVGILLFIILITTLNQQNWNVNFQTNQKYGEQEIKNEERKHKKCYGDKQQTKKQKQE